MKNNYLDQLVAALDAQLPDHPLEKDVADTGVFGCAATLYRLRKAGNAPPHVHIGTRRVYYHKESLLQWVRENCAQSMAGTTAKADA